LKGALVCFLLLAPAGWAQFRADGTASVRGQIQNAKVGESLQVELRGGGLERLSRKALVGPTGDFEFDALPLGNYQLRVRDFNGNVLHEELVSIDDAYAFLTVRLPAPQVQQPVSGIVSLRQLQQKVPSKALKEFSKARHELDKRDIQKAIDSFQKAIAVYPGYAEVHNQLGFCYSILKQFDKAAAAFQKAAEFAPDAPMPKHNLGVVLYALQDYADAG